MTPEARSAPRGGFVQGGGPLAGILAAVLLTVFVALTALVPIRADNDTWWHVKTGQYIAEHGLPENDIFSYTAADHAWHNHEWMTQLVFYQAWRLAEDFGFGGWRGVILFAGIISWLAIMGAFLLARKLTGNWWIALLMGVLAVAIGRRMFYPRPPVVTNLFLVIEVWLLLAVAEGWLRRVWLLALVPMIALWTNLHGGWMAGGVVFAAFAAEQMLPMLKKRLPPLPFPGPAGQLKFWQLAVVGILLVLATLANPYGYELYKLPARVMGDRYLVSQIGELKPPDPYFVVDFVVAVLGTFALALLVRFRPRLFDVLIYFFFLLQAINHVRHLSLFSVMMVPLTAELFGAAAAQARGGWGPARKLTNPAMGLLALLVLGWVLLNPRETTGRDAEGRAFVAWQNTYPGRFAQYVSGTGYIRENYPAAVADFIELAELEGRMWNENHYAGYLIWRLAPERHKVFSDPRFDIFGGRIMRDEQQIAAGNLDLLDEYDVQWLITKNSKVLSLILSMDKRWKPVARWPQWMGDWEIWVRDIPANAAMIERARAIGPVTGAEAPQ